MEGFDILKFICAFLIVCMHFPFPSVAGQIINTLTRIAVPIFFMITGYFYTSVIRRKRQKHQLIKILKLTAAANLLYFAVYFFGHLVKGSLGSWLGKVFSLKSIFNLLVFNESPFGIHLWYLNALIYVLLIALLFSRLHKLKLLCYAAPFLIIAELILGRYSAFIFGSPLSTIYTRNFLFLGIPCFAVGMILKKVQLFKTPAIPAVLSAVFFATSLAEKFLPTMMGVETKRENYLSTTLMAISVFILFELIYENRKTSAIESRMAVIGLKYSAWIYILHVLVGKGMAFAVKKTGLYPVYHWVECICVFAVTTAVVILFTMLRRKAERRLAAKPRD